MPFLTNLLKLASPQGTLASAFFAAEAGEEAGEGVPLPRGKAGEGLLLVG